MRVVRTVADLRSAVQEARQAAATEGAEEASAGLVPTMGALHDGHLTLARTARTENDVVVMSIFVNPTQFNEAADLAAYPRDEERDLALAAAAGVDLVFAPDAEEMYPRGHATSVRVDGPLAEVLEGASRGRGHFDGVATVVTKLLLASGADRAYFGAKDAQQARVVQRVVADLNIPTQIRVVPTVRDPDGLALSSRNVHLTDEQRQAALAIPRALQTIVAAVKAGGRDVARLEQVGRDVLADSDVETEYLAVVDSLTLEPLTTLSGPALAAVAGRVGTTRLIDNVTFEALSPNDSGGH